MFEVLRSKHYGVEPFWYEDTCTYHSIAKAFVGRVEIEFVEVRVGHQYAADWYVTIADQGELKATHFSGSFMGAKNLFMHIRTVYENYTKLEK